MGHVCIAHPSEPQFCHIQYECNNVPFIGILGFPCGSDGKKSTCNAGDLGSIPGFDPWVEKIPWRRERLATLVFHPKEFHGLSSPWSHKESDTTEQLSL